MKLLVGIAFLLVFLCVASSCLKTDYYVVEGTIKEVQWVPHVYTRHAKTTETHADAYTILIFDDGRVQAFKETYEGVIPTGVPVKITVKKCFLFGCPSLKNNQIVNIEKI